MTIENYIKNLNNRYQLGNTTEHTFRGDLQQLLESMLPEIAATNEPKRIKCGAPDYVLTRKEIPVGYIEAKDIGIKLDSKNLKEQFDRYKSALTNLIFTDYLEFHFYKEGNFTHAIKIAEVQKGKIVPLPQHFADFTLAIQNFADTVTQSIKSPNRLAEMMAVKAKFIANQIEKALDSDEETAENSELKLNYEAFKKQLINDLSHSAFADMYAQTIAYGLFAARYHDPTIPTFSREEAAKLIPHSNPFLRKLFQKIAGYDLDSRINYLVDDLVQLFLATDVKEIMQDFGKSTKQEDPVIHFYETFLAKYDPALRKAKGVWYTPQPVVHFIVRAVDEILKTEFGLSKGLADSSKTTIPIYQKGKKIEKEFHKVQILDPATGTGTFLAEVINHIHTKFKGQEGIWKQYVEKELIPRLNGFELLMASYVMAHLKLDILLGEKGFTNQNNERFRVFLTNSLEEPVNDEFNDFAQWLSTEANEANRVKIDTPVMVVLGNPPYNGESKNKGSWIMNLMEDYKKEPGGKEKLKEQNSKWINGDENKFIRFGQHFIEKNGSGILAFINPHGFLDNPTFRGMRWHLLKTFDKIYTLDLHGNSKKKEVSPDGSPDVNVFDIMQGVSINFFIKTGKKKADELGKVFHYDLFGKREAKYTFLLKNSLNTIPYKEIVKESPMYFFVEKNLKEIDIYKEGFGINQLFVKTLLGPNSHRDNFAISFDMFTANKRVKTFFDKSITDNEISILFEIEDNRDWKIRKARNYTKNPQIINCLYRPFDYRYMLYGEYAFDYHRPEINDNLLKDNYSIISTKQTKENFGIFISKTPLGQHKIATPYDGSYCSVLYSYNSNNSNQLSLEQNEVRKPNLDTAIVQKIADAIGLPFVSEKVAGSAGFQNPPNLHNFAPIDILDYIYAVLHSPTYRETYKEFLKIDFPRVPYPKDAATFWQLVALGGEIRQIHLLESEKVEDYITGYPVEGENVVGKVRYVAAVVSGDTDNGSDTDNGGVGGKVYINDTQYFSNVPEVAWSFYIGGYQPAQKWLKDRKERQLSFDDILHYQKIIVALVETDRIMKEVDKVGVC